LSFALPSQTSVLMPGLINMHTHLGMTFLRGFADDLSLGDWLMHHIWPAEGKFVSSAFVRDGAELGLAEMIRGGTTCANDM
jgi:5-methylthioadenosine/S-adenosylhomocysteine deaminase